MSKKLLWGASLIFSLCVFSSRGDAQVRHNLFEIPDSVCAGSAIIPHQIFDSAQNYNWSFCPPDLFGVPDGSNIGILPAMVHPLGIVTTLHNGTYYTYHLNQNGDLLRRRFADSLQGQPTLLTNVGHIKHAKALCSVKDNDGIYHIFVVSGTDSTNSHIFRFDFDNGTQTMPTDTTDLGVFSMLNGPNQLLMAKDGPDWYGFTFDKGDSLIRIAFGTELNSIPTTTMLGHFNGKFSQVTGVAGIEELGDWYLFVTNRGNNTIDRVSFGNSLQNAPFVDNLGNLNLQIKRPVGIAITRGCEAYYAYVINYGTNSMVTLKWDTQSVANMPIVSNRGNVAGLDQPYYLSNITDDNGTLTMYSFNQDNSLSKILFRPCTTSNIPHSNQRIPDPFSYNEPGTYTVYLTVDQGLPTVKTDCHQITIFAHPTITTTPDTLICEGDKIPLEALSLGADSILWTPDYNIDTTRGQFVDVNPTRTTQYIATTYFDTSNCVVHDTINVTVSKIHADAGPDRTIKDGSTTIIGGAETTLGNQYSYLWTPDTGIVASTGTPVTQALPPYNITYYLHVSNSDGCQAIDSVNVKVPCDDIHLPNAFIPGSSNSQVNTFRILNLQLVKINYFKVFDRWGNEVFSTTNPAKGWDGTVDGKPAPMGVYVWEIDANCANSSDRYRRTGTVTLIR